MSNISIRARTLLVLTICAPLAIFLGYIIASPLNWTAVGVYVGVGFLLAFPLLLRWNFPLLILSWNMNALVFLLPGRPPLWMLMIGMSLVFSFANFALNKREEYLSVPSLIIPLAFLTGIILVTAKLRGGIGLNSLGGQVSGGRNYVTLLAGIAGFVALTCHKIAPSNAYKYGAGYFLAGTSSMIGNLLPWVNPAFYFIFAIFPPEQSALESLGLVQESGLTRFGGVSTACTAIFCALIACYGIRGIFDFSGRLRFLPFQFRGGFKINNPWRMIIFIMVLGAGLFGGFRSVLVGFALIFAIQFCYEKLFRTRLFPAFLLLGIVGAVAVLSVAHKLPLSMQRTLSFLPVKVDPSARADARASTEWRLEIWKRVVPQIPEYFFLGKGYAVNYRELEFMANDPSKSMEVALLAGDYHSGPLSVIIPFGIFGVVAFLWFLIAGIKVLSRNYRYGDPSLRNLNRFLLVYFIAHTIFFFFVFGSLFSDMVHFTGILGLSISLNHGVRSKATPEEKTEELQSEPATQIA